MQFDQVSRIFEIILAADTILSAKAVSEIYINKNFWYPKENYTITVTFANWPGFMADDDSSTYVYSKSVKLLKIMTLHSRSKLMESGKKLDG